MREIEDGISRRQAATYFRSAAASLSDAAVAAEDSAWRRMRENLASAEASIALARNLIAKVMKRARSR